MTGLCWFFFQRYPILKSFEKYAALHCKKVTALPMLEAWPLLHFKNGKRLYFNRRCSNPKGEVPRMHLDHIKVKNLQQLRQFVSHTLCQQNDIEEGIFQITERILTRGKRSCGIFFCLHGPRSVKLTAVWETDKNSIIFYGSTGERFKRTVLSTAPKILSI